MSTASDNLVAGLAALAESIRAAATDPGVQIRLLVSLASYAPASDPTGTAAICRRVALVSLCRASANYAPSSYQDAVTLRTQIADLLDAEMTAAADAGMSATYQAFRALRLQVTTDLTTKAGSLPQVVIQTLAAPMPGLAIAELLYDDATRVDDLIARANPPNPNFFPTVFEALAS